MSGGSGVAGGLGIGVGDSVRGYVWGKIEAAFAVN